MRGELETEQNCNVLTRSFFVLSSISFSFFRAAQPGTLRSQLSAGSVSHCLELQQLTPDSRLTELHVARGYIIVLHPPASCGRNICTEFNPSTVKVIPWYFDRIHLLLDRRLGRRSICYICLLTTFLNLTQVFLHNIGSVHLIQVLQYKYDFLITYGRFQVFAYRDREHVLSFFCIDYKGTPPSQSLALSVVIIMSIGRHRLFVNERLFFQITSSYHLNGNLFNHLVFPWKISR